MTPLLVALFGGCGAVTRFVLDSAIAPRHRRPYPVGTLVINVTGSFLLGLLTAWAVRQGPGAADVKAALGTGFLGGYTTFSTASVELVRLVRARRPGTALGLGLAMLVASVAAAAAGAWLATR